MAEYNFQVEGLKRVIGVRALAASAINLTVGAGIFALPAVVYGYLGTASFLAYGVCGLFLGIVLLCFIELGTKFPQSGGAYAFVELAFGHYAGFLVNTLYAFGYAIVADAAVANVLFDTLSVFWPVLKTSGYRIPFMAILFAVFTGMNVIGVKQGVRLIELNALAKIIPLVFFIVIGLAYSDPQNFTVTTWPPLATVGEASLLLFFAFGGGAETTLNAAGEIKDPFYTIPRGLLLGVVGIFTVYLLVHLATQGILGDTLSQCTDAPLATAAAQVMGNSGKFLLAIGAAISCFGLIGGDIFATSRMVFAGARYKIFPAFLGRVHSRFATPYWSVIVYASIGFLLSISGGFRQLAVISSSSLLLIYVGVVLALLKLRKMQKAGAFQIPGGWIIPFIALGATGWFLSNLTAKEILGVLVFLAGSSVLYFLSLFVRKSSQ